METQNNGFIKLYRNFTKNIFYKNSEAVHLWIHLLFKANYHENNEFFLNYKKINLKRGQILTGRKMLSLETGISESKVFRLLKLFENEQQIEQQKTNKYTIITINNWDLYQQNEQQNEQQMNNKRTTNEQQMNTINKDNKDNKDNKYNKDNKIDNKIVIGRFIPPNLEEVKEYCFERKNKIDPQRFIDYYEARGWMIGKNKMKNWKAAIRTWENQNKQNEIKNEIKSIYKVVE